MGRREILRSLKTRDPTEAKRLAKKVGVEIDEQFEQAKGRLERFDLEQKIGPSGLSDWIQWHYSFDSPAPRTFEELDESLGEYCTQFRIDPDEAAALRDAIIEWAAEEHRPLVSKRDLDEAASRRARPNKYVEVTASQYSSSSDDAISLSILFQRWLKERKPSRKTELEYQSIVRRFESVTGVTLISEIDRAMVRRFKDVLLALPRNTPAAFKGCRIDELVEWARQQEDIETLSAGTIKKQLGAIGTLMNWAVDNAYIEKNPVGRIRLATPRHAPPRRLPYDDGDLELIFTSPLFTGCQSNMRRTEPGNKVFRDSKYWLPILALFSGARLEELGQLTIDDVKRDGDIWYLDINNLGSGKSVKTAGSVRKVPIHDQVIGLGFLDLVAGGGAKPVFPDLSPSRASGKRTDAFSKFWGRYARRIGCVDGRKVFHSFRHAFKDACRRAGIPDSQHDALTGHVPANVGGRYGLGFDVETLAEQINLISFSSVDWSVLEGQRRPLRPYSGLTKQASRT